MLTKQQIDAIKPNGKLQKEIDSDLLYLFISSTGKKVWKVLYTFEGSKNTVTLGQYPALSIKDARLKRDEIKAILASGTDPSQKRKDDKIKKLASMSLFELMQRYIAEVVPTHKGARWEAVRLNKFMRDYPRMMQRSVDQIDQLDMIEFRNDRLKNVSGSSVAREMQLLGGVFRYAISELRIIKDSPLKSVTKPKKADHRERRISEDEIQKILKVFNYDDQQQPINKLQQTAWAFLFAIETAMRASEITGLQWVNIAEKYALLPDTKNGTARRVPLSHRAVDLLALAKGIDSDSVLTVGSDVLSNYFTKHVKKLDIIDLRFHDTRHEATTRLAQKLSIQDLAKVTGHKDLKMLMRYYNPTAIELADRINRADGY